MSVSLQTLTVTLLIRPMEPKDLNEVQAIDKASFTMPWPTSAYHYELNENPLSMLWVAEHTKPNGDIQVVGMIVIWFIVDEVHIATIAVHPDYRRRTIAKSLLTTALDAALQKGFKTATLEVRANNASAQRLYKDFGFGIVGYLPKYYRDNNEDAVIMTIDNMDRARPEWPKTDYGSNGKAMDSGYS